MFILCICVGLACIAYFCVLAVYAGPTFDFGWFWLALGAAFLLAAYFSRGSNPAAVLVSRILLTVLGAGLIAIAALSSFVLQGMSEKNAEGLPYVIVLGAQVRGTKPSRALLRRLETAEKTVLQNPDTILILSGGQGKNEDISEADCMWNYLTERGISEDRLIREDKSTSTWENLIFSDRLTGCGEKSCGILSNDFHITRACLTAGKAGYADPRGIAAEGDPIMELHYIVRETAALLYGRMRGKL